MKQYFLKGKTVNVLAEVNPNPSLNKWYTFQDGEVVPEYLVDLIKNQGGNVYESNNIEVKNEVERFESEVPLLEDKPKVQKAKVSKKK